MTSPESTPADDDLSADRDDVLAEFKLQPATALIARNTAATARACCLLMSVGRVGTAAGSATPAALVHAGVMVSRRILVVGGGIAGLAAAHRLREKRPADEVVVLEGSDRVGGKLCTVEVAGISVDVGAEAMLNRRPEATGLARAVGLGGALVHPATAGAQLWNRNRLVALPRTLMGVPGDVAVTREVLSRGGQLRAAIEPRLPPTELGDADVSVGSLVQERFGREVVDRLVEPLLGGVYAGHARELSARATVPQIVAMLDRDRSLMHAAAAALGPATGNGSTVPVFAGIKGGVGRLARATAAGLGESLRLRATVRDLTRRPEGGWRLVVGDARDPRLEDADVVVLATPARATARLLSDVAPHAALDLARIEYASMAIVTLALRASDFPEVVGSGFLVPPVDGHRIKAATYSFAKWGWVRDAGGSVEEPVRLVRCSIGRHREEADLQVGDEELASIALRDLRAAIGADVVPLDTHVQRWGGALPQYAVGHLDLVARVRAEIDRLTGLAVCGAAYDGLGIPACIASADRAVAKVLGELGRMDP